MNQVLGPSGRPIPSSVIERARAQANADGPIDFGKVYDGSHLRGTWFTNWHARLQSADRDWIPERNSVTARTYDLFRNDPLVPAAVNRKRNAAVGRGWRFSSKPNARALGVTPQVARELGLAIETEFKLYAYGHDFQSDAERRMSFGQQLRVAASHLALQNEFLGLVEYAGEETTRYKTRLRLVDPDRLSNPMGRMDDDFLRGGVEHNAARVPLRYWIRERHPLDLGFSSFNLKWNPWERFATPLGRPQVLHGFDPDRAEQTRGVTRFAAALKSFRSLARFSDATLQSATINALVLGYIKSSTGAKDLSESFSADDLTKFEGDREAWYGKNPISMGSAILPALPLGDELELATAAKDVGAYDSFVRSVIRVIAASLGVTYEELSMDYSQTNYSSARAAMVHAWAETLAFMGVLEDQLVKPFFVAWLEEAFDSAYIVPPAGAPDFYDAIDAYATGRWIGPGRGFIDPTKEILAAAARIEAGISTLEDECADQGKDYMDVLEQQAFEQEVRAQLGLQPLGPAIAQSVQDTKNPTKEAPATGQAPEDQRPADSDKPGAQRGALAQIRGFAMSAEHEASLDARPRQVAA